ncbi:MAG: hypothetical protein HOV82_17120 [Streptomyces sp.]|nr:hypothetical protein [Streptomyces sp.]NUP36187.1 hypothetical protein [Streptomyces sp.]NUS75534.1 hypothetical protein [Streptomyces sp.]
MTNQQPTARTAADLPKGTRVTDTEGRMGTVNGVDVGRVTIPDHENYGREYVGVDWDPDEKCPWGDRSRPFIDELAIEATPEADTNEVTVSRESALHAARVALADLKATDWTVNPAYWVGRLETALAQLVGDTDQVAPKTPDLRALANPKKADPETIAEIHASRCPECKGAGCPQCGYKGTPRAACPAHHVVDKRGGRAIELGSVPTCEAGITYGAWSEGAGGFVYSGDCATEVANWAADELRKLAKDDDSDKFEVLAMCPDHDEQPKDGCEECAAEGE